MSVHDKQTIDRCGQATDGTALLTIYCPGLLGQDYTFEDLGEKAETYLDFVLSGQLVEDFPQCKDRQIVFRISCELWPNSSYKPRFSKMARQLSEYGVKLIVEVSSLTVSGGIFNYEQGST